MFGYPNLTTVEQVEALKKKRPIFKKAGDKMGYFFLTERGRRARDLNERIRRDWFAIKKFAVDQGYESGRQDGLKEGREEGREEGEKKEKTRSFIKIASFRFPDQFSKTSDDWNALLESKSDSELDDLIDACLQCQSFQEIADRL